MLNPQSPLFREARYLLAEETEIRDPALYHSVLGAIAAGNHTNGGIASFVGRKSAEITHPLNVLEDCALIAREPDLFRLESNLPGHRALITFLRRSWTSMVPAGVGLAGRSGETSEPISSPCRRAAFRNPLPKLRPSRRLRTSSDRRLAKSVPVS